MHARVSNVARVDQGMCRATFDLHMPSGAVLHGCSLRLEPNGIFSVAPPRAPVLDERFRIVRDERNHPMWRPVMTFASDELRERFRVTAIDALMAQHPHIFD